MFFYRVFLIKNDNYMVFMFTFGKIKLDYQFNLPVWKIN